MLRDKPSPLFQLLVLTMLSSARIAADIAVASARKLFVAGWRTPEKLRDATWQERVDALVRVGYRRHDSTSTQLEKLATHVIDVHDGDLEAFGQSRTSAWTTFSP
jgi:endonuclease III